VFDDELVLVLHFTGDGESAVDRMELTRDPKVLDARCPETSAPGAETATSLYPSPLKSFSARGAAAVAEAASGPPMRVARGAVPKAGLRSLRTAGSPEARAERTLRRPASLRGSCAGRLGDEPC